MDRETVQVVEENIYFDMELGKETGTVVYENITGDSRTVLEVNKKALEEGESEKKRASRKPFRKRLPSAQSDEQVVRRLLCIIIAVVSVFFLIAACTMILAVLVLMFHPAGTATPDFASMQAEMEDMKRNFSLKASHLKDKIAALSQEIQTMQGQVVKQLNHQKENMTVLWQAVQTNKKNIQQLRPQKNITVLWQLVQTNRINIKQLRGKVMNISTLPGPQGPAGPPGHNGTQGPPGVAGPPGSSDSSGSGNLSLCTYNQKKSSPFAKGKLARISVTATEQKGQKFLGVNCDTNDASVVELSSTPLSNGLIEYKCRCKGTVNSGDPKMHCVIHYWECPV